MKNLLFPTFFVVVFLAILEGNLWGAEFCVNNESSLQTSLTNAGTNGEDNVIKVEQGTYYGNFNYLSILSMEGRSITLRGGYTSGCANRVLYPSNTIIDGNNLDTVLSINATSGGNIFIEGFRIQNGKTPYGGVGGGIYASSISFSSGVAGDVTIINNIVTGNSSTSSGGISATSRSFDDSSGNVTISNNTITNNTAHVAGGISALSWTGSDKGGNVIIIGNTIEGNSAEAGAGGIHAATQSFSNLCTDGDITLENNMVKGNAGGTIGGGIFVQSGSLSGASIGGKVRLANNKILGNSTYTGGGGGIYISSYSEGKSGNIFFFNNIIAGNSSGGFGGGVSVGGNHIFAERDMIFTNNTITENTAEYGGGVCFSSILEGYKTISFFNNIIWGNNASRTGGDIILDGTDTINGYNNDYFDIEGSWTESENNINRSPLFVDTANRDFHLKPASPCIDKGTNEALGIPNTDFEGDPRIFDANNDGTATVDIGADEFIGQAKVTPFLPFLPLLLLDD